MLIILASCSLLIAFQKLTFLLGCSANLSVFDWNFVAVKIEKVAKAYKVEFVINISELGEDDPLLQNATWYFPSLKVPW